MNVHEDLLNNGENNCSFTEDEVDIMCSEDGDDACGDGLFDVKGRREIGSKALEIRGFSSVSSRWRRQSLRENLSTADRRKKCGSGVAEIDVIKWS